MIIPSHTITGQDMDNNSSTHSTNTTRKNPNALSAKGKTFVTVACDVWCTTTNNVMLTKRGSKVLTCDSTITKPGEASSKIAGKTNMTDVAQTRNPPPAPKRQQGSSYRRIIRKREGPKTGRASSQNPPKTLNKMNGTNILMMTLSMTSKIVSSNKQQNKKETSNKDTKRVSFKRRISSVQATICRKDYTPEDVQATWYSEDEYTNMCKSCVKELSKMESGKNLLSKKYCSRGLEGQTRMGYKIKSKNRADALQAVLTMQEMIQQQQQGREQQPEQKTQDIYDTTVHGTIAYHTAASVSTTIAAGEEEVDKEMLIAQAYYQITSSCQLWAHAAGLADQRAVEEDTIEDVMSVYYGENKTKNNTDQQSLLLLPSSSGSFSSSSTTTTTSCPLSLLSENSNEDTTTSTTETFCSTTSNISMQENDDKKSTLAPRLFSTTSRTTKKLLDCCYVLGGGGGGGGDSVQVVQKEPTTKWFHQVKRNTPLAPSA